MDRLIIEVDLDIVLKQYIADDAHAIFQLINNSRDHLSQYGDTTAEKYLTVELVFESIIKPKNPQRLRPGIWDDNALVGGINLTSNEDSRGIQLLRLDIG